MKQQQSLSVNIAHDYCQSFCIKNPIGRGGGSFVCKIVHRHTQQEFAAKIVQKSDAKQLARLKNEVQIHLQLHHQNIVELHQHLEDSDNHYLVMELCEHELYQFIKTRPDSRLTEQEVRFYGLQLVKGLDFLHKQNIIHRDLKLGNLLLKDDNLKIADFGLAIQLTDSEEERNTLCGTPNYISPEILSQQPYGKKVDLWSLGCCLFAMKQGRGPFETPKILLGDVLKKVQKGNFTLPQGISPAFEDLLVNLINLDASQRYDTARLLEHPFFLDRVVRSLSIQHLDPQPVTDNNTLPISPSFPICTTNSKPETRQRENSSSNLRNLVTLSPFLPSKGHRQSNSVASLTGTKVVNQFLQQQHDMGSKKVLFGMTTIGKQSQPKIFDSGCMPKFSLAKEVTQPDKENNQWLANQIFKKLGLDQTSPLKLRDVKPCKIQTKNGYFQIGEDGTFQMEISNKDLIFNISEDGKTVNVTKKGQKQKVFPLDKLPEKLKKFYEYSKQVCSAIKEKSIKYKLDNEHGNFQLRQGKNGLVFEAVLASKLQIIHPLSTDKVLIISGTQEIDSNLSNQQYQKEIKLVLKFLSQCLNEKCTN